MLDKATKASIAISKTHLFNNPNVCIKNYGSTFACVCKDCMKEMHEFVQKLSEELNENKLLNN